MNDFVTKGAGKIRTKFNLFWYFIALLWHKSPRIDTPDYKYNEIRAKLCFSGRKYDSVALNKAKNNG